MDGSCLYHALACGINALTGGGANFVSGSMLRHHLAQYVAERADGVAVAGMPLREWVRLDAGVTPNAYARRMRHTSSWGGGIEMAALANACNLAIEVYESPNMRRIGAFRPDVGGEIATVGVLYRGRSHYDALLPLALTRT